MKPTEQTSADHVTAQDAVTSSGMENGKLDAHGEIQELLTALHGVRNGDFSVRLPNDWTLLWGKIADAFNEIVATNERMAQQLDSVGNHVGREGRTRQRVKLGARGGAWLGMEESVNTLIDDLLWPTAEVTRTIEAVAQGNLLQTMRLEVDGRPLKGEFLRSANIVNTMIRQLSIFTSEVTRVAREVGTDGKLGGQAQVREVTGVWKDLTESVNSMASNLTAQVRNIAEVTIAVAHGDLVEEDHRGRARRNPAAEGSHQHDGGSAPLLRRGGDARRARSRHRRAAGRPGRGAGRCGHLERPHRQRQSARRQSDDPGPQHRRSDHRRRARRPVAQDHRRCEGRNPGAEGHHQHHGGPAQRLRLGSDARGARSRHRRQAGRSGASAGRRGHLERPDRQRQLDGLRI